VQARRPCASSPASPPSEVALLPGKTAPTRPPSLLVATSNLLSGDSTVEQLAALRRSGTPSVAVVAATIAQLPRIAKHFDAVLPVDVPPNGDAVFWLRAALMAVTAFARGNVLSNAVDDVCPFFVRPGFRLRIGRTVAPTAEAAVLEALHVCGVQDSRPADAVRVLLHVEAREAVFDHLLRGAQAVVDLVHHGHVALSASTAREAGVHVSLVASVPIQRWT